MTLNGPILIYTVNTVSANPSLYTEEGRLTRLTGPMVRIAPNEVSIDDPEDSLRIIYGHGTKFIKARAWNPLQQLCG